MQTLSPHPLPRQPRWVTESRVVTFARLMELYEKNYALLELLLGEQAMRVTQPLHYSNRRYRWTLTALECERYTTTAVLTCQLLGRRRHPLARIVQLKIRIYRDTRQAELLCSEKHLRKEAAPKLGAERAIVVRWVLNRFLNKLLKSMLLPRYSRDALSSKPRVG